MPDPDPWLALAARARAALPEPPRPSADALRRPYLAPPIPPVSWWPRLATLAVATLVIALGLAVIARRSSSPFALDELELAWRR